MEIKVIVGNVEIYYYQESEATAANSATCREDYSANSKNSILLGTIREMAKLAGELVRGQVDA
jgi:hypothetical protein